MGDLSGPSGLIRPATDWCPPRASSGGAEAAELVARAGRPLDPWQALAVDRILSERADGTPAAFESGLVVPRQNGKGNVEEAVEVYWLFIVGVGLVLHSAHEFKAARQAFQRMVSLLRGCPDLWAEVTDVKTGAGNECIELRGGRMLRYVARSKGSGRSFAADKLLMDEAYALDDDEMAAQIPTLATRDQAQVVYGSSAPLGDSHVLHRVVRRGRAGGDPELSFTEWRAAGGQTEPGCAVEGCAHVAGTPGCVLDDQGLWRAANPGRIGLGFIGRERRAMEPMRFSRERLGWETPEEGAAGTAIDQERWAQLVGACERSGPVVLSVDVAPDRATSAIGLGGTDADGGRMVRLVRHGPGTSWVVDAVRGLARRGVAAVVIDGVGPVSSLEEDITDAVDGWCPVVVMTGGDVADACAGLHDAVVEGLVRHPGQALLDLAVQGARRRRMPGGRFAWDRESSEVDITPLVACTYALWGFVRYGDAGSLLA